MKNFVSIDFETANPQRVSACSLGYAIFNNANVVDFSSILIKPVGGHADFQSKIHGIKEEHTFDKPRFDEVYPEIKHLFEFPLVAHSLFDMQVLNALSNYFDLEITFDYTDSSKLAKEVLPNLKNHKLKTLVSHFNLPSFKHHDAMEDAIACANIYLKLFEQANKIDSSIPLDDKIEFKGLIHGILADNEVNYKEAYQLLYWLYDHKTISDQYTSLFDKTKSVLEDDILEDIEALDLKTELKKTLLDL